MAQQEQYPDWFLWLWEKGPRLFVILGAVFAVIVLGVTIYLDGRLSDIEERLEYVPPKSYEPPNLAGYAAGDVSLDAALARLVYVPVYSHIYYHGGSPYQLETTLSIRNVDRQQPVYINSVEYFDTNGKPVKTYVDRTIKLAPLQTIEFLVASRDSSGGSGANFLVEWIAENGVAKPLVEAVMVGTVGTQAICFARTGEEISRPTDGSGQAP